MSTVDPIAAILADLDRPATVRQEFADALLSRLLAELTAPAPGRVLIARPARLYRGRVARVTDPQQTTTTWLPRWQWRRVILVFALVVVGVVVVGSALAAFGYHPLVGLRAAAGSAEAKEKIAFTSDRDGNSEVYLMNAGGSGQRNLTRNPAQDGSPAWSPDGRRIAFTSDRDGSYGVYLMNADGSNQRQLTQDRACCIQDSAWSPDGRKIAFTRGHDGRDHVYVINADGSGQRRLTRNPAEDGSPVWSPDGRRIAFTRGHGRYGVGRTDVYVINADGSGQRRLTRYPANGSSPAWSPDGRRIAFTSDRDGSYGVYLMNADGSNQRQLTQNGGDSPVWSPHGRRIAFTSGGFGRDDVYVMNADGSGQRNLTRNPAQDGNPVWSPDGRRIAFTRNPADCGLGFCDREVHLMNADGSGQRNLTRIPSAHEENPAWSPVALVVPVADGGAAAAKASPLPPKLLGQWTRKFTAADGKRTGLGPQGWGGVWTLTIEKNGAVSVSIPAALQGWGPRPFTGRIVSVGGNRVRVSVFSFVVVYSWRVSGRLLTLTKSASTAGVNTFYLGVWKRT